MSATSSAEGAESHELLRAFAKHGFVFNGTLHEMLNEHFSHHSERRGCGFTQATRHLAVLVNRGREHCRDATIKLFPELARVVDKDGLPPALKERIAGVPADLSREESQTFAAIVADVLMPSTSDPGVQELNPYAEALKVGTCPLAEKYFLEIADRVVRPKGRLSARTMR